MTRSDSSPCQDQPRPSGTERIKDLEILKRECEDLRTMVESLSGSLVYLSKTTGSLIASLDTVNKTLGVAKNVHNANFKYSQENRGRIERLEALVDAYGLGFIHSKMN